MQSHVDEKKILLNTTLIKASWQGDLESVKRCIQDGADINTTMQNHHKTPLMSAASDAKFDVVKFLVAAGANIHAFDDYHRTALMYAVADSSGMEVEDNLKIIRFLIQSGADIEAVDERGQTALMWAIDLDDIPSAELLIELGANVNHVDGYGKTPLMYAAGHPKLIEKLVRAGANVNFKDKKDDTALMYATACRESVDILIQHGADRNELFKNGKTELMYAVLWNDIALATKLVDEGADINAQDKQGDTVLKIATQREKIDFVRCLIQRGVKLDIPDHEGKTALLYAINKEILMLLIQSGADINVVSRKGRTALIDAVDWGYKDVVELLLDKGIKKEVLNAKFTSFRNAYTALFLAVTKTKKSFEEYKEILALLLKAGADPNIECDGLTASYLLSSLGYPYNEQSLLHKEMHEVNDSAPDNNCLDAEDFFNQQDHLGRTLLHTAVFYGKLDEVDQLLKMGCDITLADKKGLTALELAQELQKNFTHRVSPTFFSGKETFIRASNCAVWKKIEEMIIAHSCPIKRP